jgi:hypothetical protein
MHTQALDGDAEIAARWQCPMNDSNNQPFIGAVPSNVSAPLKYKMRYAIVEL